MTVDPGRAPVGSRTPGGGARAVYGPPRAGDGGWPVGTARTEVPGAQPRRRDPEQTLTVEGRSGGRRRGAAGHATVREFASVDELRAAQFATAPASPSRGPGRRHRAQGSAAPDATDAARPVESPPTPSRTPPSSFPPGVGPGALDGLIGRRRWPHRCDLPAVGIEATWPRSDGATAPDTADTLTAPRPDGGRGHARRETYGSPDPRADRGPGGPARGRTNRVLDTGVTSIPRRAAHITTRLDFFRDHLTNGPGRDCDLPRPARSVRAGSGHRSGGRGLGPALVISAQANDCSISCRPG